MKDIAPSRTWVILPGAEVKRLDTIYDYYDKSGILDNGNEYVDIDIDDIARFIAKEAKKNNIGEYLPEELFFIVEGELAYNGVIDDEE